MAAAAEKPMTVDSYPDPAFVGCRFAMEQQSSNLFRVAPIAVVRTASARVTLPVRQRQPEAWVETSKS
jgi:hypothetical protein